MTVYPVLQAFEKDPTKIIFAINQLSRGLSAGVGSGGGGGRTQLTTNTTFNVAAGGSIQAMYDDLVANYDFGGKDHTIQLAAGTYTAGLYMRSGWTGGGSLTLRGDPTTPANVSVSLTTAGTTLGYCILCEATLPGVFTINGMKLQTTVVTNQASCLGLSRPSQIVMTNIDFGTAVNHIVAGGAGFVQVSGTSTISAGATRHFLASSGIILCNSSVYTLNSKPVFTTAFAVSTSSPGRIDAANVTFKDQAGHVRRSGTGTSTAASAIVTGITITGGGNTSLLTVGMAVVGTNIPSNAVINSIDSTTQITMNVAATGANTGLKFEIATGKKFDVSFLGGINTISAGADYFPGTIAGTVNAGQFGVYL